MIYQTLRIATRKSPLALWQAHHVRQALLQFHPRLRIELLEMTTQGDKILDSPLARIGGKGLFVKELEQGLLTGQADIAVHSMKDVPAELPAGLHLPVIMSRENPFDAFVSNHTTHFAQLPLGAIVGTSSLRRQTQLLSLRPDLQIRNLRGNVGTRLRKLDSGEFDAIILAAAGLRRLGLTDRIQEILKPHTMLPAIGQGAIGIECRQDDTDTHLLISILNNFITQRRVQAERAFNHTLAGSCQVPIGGFAELTERGLLLRGLVGDVTGQHVIRGHIEGTIEQAETMGEQLAQQLLAQGAHHILNALRE